MTKPLPYCSRGPHRLDLAAVLSGFDWCTDCERKQFSADIALGRDLRDRGQEQATDAHPDDRARVDAAIRDAAATGRPFSANSIRDVHGCTGGVVGAAFSAARKAGLIEAVGDDDSTGASAHGHRIYQWRGVAA